MTIKSPFDMMMDQMQDMAKAINPALSSFDMSDWEKLWPTMTKDTMDMFFGASVNPDGLDAKTRMLLTLAGLTMQGAQAETPLRMTVRHAKAAGASDAEIAQTIAQMGMFAGLPAMKRAMDLAQTVLNENEDTEQ